MPGIESGKGVQIPLRATPKYAVRGHANCTSHGLQSAPSGPLHDTCDGPKAAVPHVLTSAAEMPSARAMKGW